MSAAGSAERVETDQMPAVNVAPATQLTPMQMAYQLVAKGSDFASVREVLDYSKGLEREAAEAAFNIAMTATQAQMSVIATNQNNVQTKSRYADYAQLDKAMRPIYSRNGFALSFDEEEIAKPDFVRIVCYVSHTGGHTRKYHRDMPADGKGAKGGDVMTKTHAAGAAGSYAMRYILRGIFNIAVGEEDKDGNTSPLAINDQQRTELDKLIDATKADLTKFLAFFQVEFLAELPSARFAEAKKMLEAKRK